MKLDPNCTFNCHALAPSYLVEVYPPKACLWCMWEKFLQYFEQALKHCNCIYFFLATQYLEFPPIIWDRFSVVCLQIFKGRKFPLLYLTLNLFLNYIGNNILQLWPKVESYIWIFQQWWKWDTLSPILCSVAHLFGTHTIDVLLIYIYKDCKHQS